MAPYNETYLGLDEPQLATALTTWYAETLPKVTGIVGLPAIGTERLKGSGFEHDVQQQILGPMFDQLAEAGFAIVRRDDEAGTKAGVGAGAEERRLD